jgi:hypothetical protein
MVQFTVYKRYGMRHDRHVRVATFLVGVITAVPVRGSGLPEPGTWIPPTASFVAFVDVGTLLSSPALQGLETLLSRQISPAEIESFRELTGMDPWRDFQALSFFTGTAPEGEEVEDARELWGVAIAGGFDTERILESMEQRIRVEHHQYRKTPFYVFDPGATAGAGAPQGDQGPHALAFPDGSTALFGPAESVRLMLDAGLGFGPSPSPDRLQADLDELSGCDAICIVGVGSAGPGKRFRQGTELPVLRSFALSLRTGTALRVRGRAEAESPEAASKLADLVRGAFALGALSTKSGRSAPALESVEVETIDDRIEVSFEVDGRAVRDWLREGVKAAPSKSTAR